MKFDGSYPKNTKDNLAFRHNLTKEYQTKPEMLTLLKALCKEDILFWINTFCWTYNPRKTPSAIPFITYGFQDELILDLVEHIKQQRDMLTDKSRDMGVTWCVLTVFQHFWQFGETGNDFLVGSRKEDYVDKKGDMDALFPKIEFALREQPYFLLPDGLNMNKHRNHMNIINPVTGSTISGEATNENFARGGRRRAILFDEFAFWDVAQAAWRSSADTTNCRLPVSTPHGLNNHFAKLRFSGSIDTRSLHWRDHPEKDDEWYEKECARRNHDTVDIAQELDINYEASEEQILFPWESLRRATKVEINFSPEKIVLGFDPAGEGDDEAVIYVSNNGNVVDRKYIAKCEPMQLAGEIVSLARRWKAQVIIGDAIGSDVINAVAHILGPNREGIKVVGFKGSERAKDPVRYFNARAELFHYAAQQIKSGNTQVDDDYTLMRQLNATKYDTVDGRLKIIKKELIKEMVGSSPDRADAMALTIWGMQFTHSRAEVENREQFRAARRLLTARGQEERGGIYGDWHDGY